MADLEAAEQLFGRLSFLGAKVGSSADLASGLRPAEAMDYLVRIFNELDSASISNIGCRSILSVLLMSQFVGDASPLNVLDEPPFMQGVIDRLPPALSGLTRRAGSYKSDRRMVEQCWGKGGEMYQEPGSESAAWRTEEQELELRIGPKKRRVTFTPCKVWRVLLGLAWADEDGDPKSVVMNAVERMARDNAATSSIHSRFMRYLPLSSRSNVAFVVMQDILARTHSPYRSVTPYASWYGDHAICSVAGTILKGMANMTSRKPFGALLERHIMQPAPFQRPALWHSDYAKGMAQEFASRFASQMLSTASIEQDVAAEIMDDKQLQLMAFRMTAAMTFLVGVQVRSPNLLKLPGVRRVEHRGAFTRFVMEDVSHIAYFDSSTLPGLSYAIQSPISFALYSGVSSFVSAASNRNLHGSSPALEARDFTPLLTEVVKAYSSFISRAERSTPHDETSSAISRSRSILGVECNRWKLQKISKVSQLVVAYGAPEADPTVNKDVLEKMRVIDKEAKDLDPEYYGLNQTAGRLANAGGTYDTASSINAARWGRVLFAGGGTVDGLRSKVLSQNQAATSLWARKGYKADQSEHKAKLLLRTIGFMVLRSIERLLAKRGILTKSEFDLAFGQVESLEEPLSPTSVVDDDEGAQSDCSAEDRASVDTVEFLQKAREDDHEGAKKYDDYRPTLPRNCEVREIKLPFAAFVTSNGHKSPAFLLPDTLTVADIVAEHPVTVGLENLVLDICHFDYLDYACHEAKAVGAVLDPPSLVKHLETRMLAEPVFRPTQPLGEVKSKPHALSWSLKSEAGKDPLPELSPAAAELIDFALAHSQTETEEFFQQKKEEYNKLPGYEAPSSVPHWSPDRRASPNERLCGCPSQAFRKEAGSRTTAALSTNAKPGIRTLNQAARAILELLPAVTPGSSGRDRLKRDRLWKSALDAAPTGLARCPDYKSWSVQQKRTFYELLHDGISKMVGLRAGIAKRTFDQMTNVAAGSLSASTDGYVQGLYETPDTLINLAAQVLGIGKVTAGKGATAADLVADLLLTDCNIDDAATAVSTTDAAGAVELTTQGGVATEQFMCSEEDRDKTLTHSALRQFVGIFNENGFRLPSDQRTAASVVLQLGTQEQAVGTEVVSMFTKACSLLDADASQGIVLPFASLVTACATFAFTIQSIPRCCQTMASREGRLLASCLLLPEPIGLGVVKASSLLLPTPDPMCAAFQSMLSTPSAMHASALRLFITRSGDAASNAELDQDPPSKAEVLRMRIEDLSSLLSRVIGSNSGKAMGRLRRLDAVGEVQTSPPAMQVTKSDAKTLEDLLDVVPLADLGCLMDSLSSYRKRMEWSEDRALSTRAMIDKLGEAPVRAVKRQIDIDILRVFQAVLGNVAPYRRKESSTEFELNPPLDDHKARNQPCHEWLRREPVKSEGRDINNYVVLGESSDVRPNRSVAIAWQWFAEGACVPEELSSIFWPLAAMRRWQLRDIMMLGFQNVVFPSEAASFSISSFQQDIIEAGLIADLESEGSKFEPLSRSMPSARIPAFEPLVYDDDEVTIGHMILPPGTCVAECSDLERFGYALNTWRSNAGLHVPNVQKTQGLFVGIGGHAPGAVKRDFDFVRSLFLAAEASPFSELSSSLREWWTVSPHFSTIQGCGIVFPLKMMSATTFEDISGTSYGSTTLASAKTNAQAAFRKRAIPIQGSGLQADASFRVQVTMASLTAGCGLRWVLNAKEGHLLRRRDILRVPDVSRKLGGLDFRMLDMLDSQALSVRVPSTKYLKRLEIKRPPRSDLVEQLGSMTPEHDFLRAISVASKDYLTRTSATLELVTKSCGALCNMHELLFTTGTSITLEASVIIKGIREIMAFCYSARIHLSETEHRDRDLWTVDLPLTEILAWPQNSRGDLEGLSRTTSRAISNAFGLLLMSKAKRSHAFEKIKETRLRSVAAVTYGGEAAKVQHRGSGDQMAQMLHIASAAGLATSQSADELARAKAKVAELADRNQTVEEVVLVETRLQVSATWCLGRAMMCFNSENSKLHTAFLEALSMLTKAAMAFRAPTYDDYGAGTSSIRMVLPEDSSLSRELPLSDQFRRFLDARLSSLDVMEAAAGSLMRNKDTFLDADGMEAKLRQLHKAFILSMDDAPLLFHVTLTNPRELVQDANGREQVERANEQLSEEDAAPFFYRTLRGFPRRLNSIVSSALRGQRYQGVNLFGLQIVREF